MTRDPNGLSARKIGILKAIIDAHIKNGEPVGSKYLTQNKQIALSSATIRNEMAELEDMGYLEQPHTSAGRVPSEHGYRFYVDSILENYRANAHELRRMNELMKLKLTELDNILDNASKLMASLTNYTSLSVKPKKKATLMKSCKLVLLDSQNFLVVMILDDDEVKTKQIRVRYFVNESMLARLEPVLNEFIAGIPSEQITLQRIMMIEKHAPDCEDIISAIIKAIYETLESVDGGNLKLEGMNLLLQYPEYSDMNSFRKMLDILEKKEKLISLVENSNKDMMNVLIGSESNVEGMNNTSFVFKTISSGGKVIGTIGVIGPCRMDYTNVISTVNYLADSISDAVKKQSDPPPGIDGKNQT